MFWILEIFPDWFWWLLFLCGISAFLLSYLNLLTPYQIILKNVGLVVVAVTIFIFGMLYADNTWKAEARELQAKISVLETQSQQVNEVIKEKIVTKTQIVKLRGADNIKYIDREVVKTDSACVISPEFVGAHNSAAEPLK